MNFTDVTKPHKKVENIFCLFFYFFLYWITPYPNAFLQCYRGYNVEKRTELISLYFCPKKGKILWWLYDIFVQLLIAHGSFVAYPSTDAMGKINF